MNTMENTTIKDIETVKELAILLVSELEHIGRRQDEANSKLDKITACIYGNGQEGMKETLARHEQFIEKAIEENVIEETRANSRFRETAKTFALKLLLAAAGIGGGTSALWNALS